MKLSRWNVDLTRWTSNPRDKVMVEGILMTDAISADISVKNLSLDEGFSIADVISADLG